MTDYKIVRARKLIALFDKTHGRPLDEANELMAWLDTAEGGTEFDTEVERRHRAAQTTRALDEFQRQRGRPRVMRRIRPRRPLRHRPDQPQPTTRANCVRDVN